jgi:hypothetical protein
MSKSKPLTSEERCRKAFEEVEMSRPEINSLDSESLVWYRMGWKACWRYLESRVTEFVTS